MAAELDALDADAIMIAVQEIFEVVQAEFLVAAEGIEKGGTWSGVDADARGRITRKTREEVNRIKSVFDRIQAGISAVDGAHMTPQQLEDAIRDERVKLDRLLLAKAQLVELVKNVEEAGGAAEQPSQFS